MVGTVAQRNNDYHASPRPNSSVITPGRAHRPNSVPTSRILPNSTAAPQDHSLGKEADISSSKDMWFRNPSIVWYRGHDLRVEDHPALLAAAQRGGPVVSLFIWDPSDEFSISLGDVKKWWLRQSLMQLDRNLTRLGSTLFARVGDSTEQIRSVISATGADAVFWNRRYEPDLLHRDERLRAHLVSMGLTAESFKSELIVEPWELTYSSTSPRFQDFHSYLRCWLNLPSPPLPLPSPPHLKRLGFDIVSVDIDDLGLEVSPQVSDTLAKIWKPGNANGRSVLQFFLENSFHSFGNVRNRRNTRGTSRLSPYIRFGEISPRRLFFSVLLYVTKTSRLSSSKTSTDRTRRRGAGSVDLDFDRVEGNGTNGNDALTNIKSAAATSSAIRAFLKNLCLRDFAYHTLFHKPDFDTEPLIPEFHRFPWAPSDGSFAVWCEGRTGYPIVDAAMRNLNVTGWIHNRMRFLLASFLTKQMLLPWAKGLRAFYELLVDGDQASNALGWQWTAGSNTDAFPATNIVNPIKLGQQYNPDGNYIRKWVPELEHLPTEYLHEPWKAPKHILDSAGVQLGSSYPNRIILMSTARQRYHRVLWSMRKVLSQSKVSKSLSLNGEKVTVTEWPLPKEVQQEEDSSPLGQLRLLSSLWSLTPTESVDGYPLKPLSFENHFPAVDSAHLDDDVLTIPNGDQHESIGYTLLSACGVIPAANDLAPDTLNILSDHFITDDIFTDVVEVSPTDRNIAMKNIDDQQEGSASYDCLLENSRTPVNSGGLGRFVATASDDSLSRFGADQLIRNEKAPLTQRGECQVPDVHSYMPQDDGTHSPSKKVRKAKEHDPVSYDVGNALKTSLGREDVSNGFSTRRQHSVPEYQSSFHAQVPPTSLRLINNGNFAPTSVPYSEAVSSPQAMPSNTDRKSVDTADVPYDSIGQGNPNFNTEQDDDALVETPDMGHTHGARFPSSYGTPFFIPMMEMHPFQRIDLSNMNADAAKSNNFVSAFGNYPNGVFDPNRTGGNGAPLGFLPYAMPHMSLPVTATTPVANMPPNYAPLHVPQHVFSHAPISMQSPPPHTSRSGGVSMDGSKAMMRTPGLTEEVTIGKDILPTEVGFTSLHSTGMEPAPYGEPAEKPMVLSNKTSGSLDKNGFRLRPGSNGVSGHGRRKRSKTPSDNRPCSEDNGGQPFSSLMTDETAGREPKEATGASSTMRKIRDNTESTHEQSLPLGRGMANPTEHINSAPNFRIGKSNATSAERNAPRKRARQRSKTKNARVSASPDAIVPVGENMVSNDSSRVKIIDGVAKESFVNGKTPVGTAVKASKIGADTNANSVSKCPSTLKDREEVLESIMGQDDHEYRNFAKFLHDNYELTSNTDRRTSKEYVRLCNLKDYFHNQCETDKEKLKIYRIKSFFSKVLKLEVTGEWDRHNHGGVRGPYVYGIRRRIAK